MDANALLWIQSFTFQLLLRTSCAKKTNRFGALRAIAGSLSCPLLLISAFSAVKLASLKHSTMKGTSSVAVVGAGWKPHCCMSWPTTISVLASSWGPCWGFCCPNGGGISCGKCVAWVLLCLGAGVWRFARAVRLDPSPLKRALFRTSMPSSSSMLFPQVLGLLIPLECNCKI